MDSLSDYDYELPRELIAQEPLARRSDARLLILDRQTGRIEHQHIRDLPELLSADDCLVLNDTRVLPARLVGRRASTAGRWEGLFLAADSDGNWRLLAKSRGKLAAGETIILVDPQGKDAAELRLLLHDADGGWVARPIPHVAPLELLERVGRVPLPPYIRQGEMVTADRERYQTVFARVPGSVAAPTAGLHFTPELLARLEDLGVQVCRITLHVGLATFRPITAPSLAEHTMHSEWGEISDDTAQRIRAARGRVIAVGTTSVRVLETAGAGGELKAWQGHTGLFIRPPYQFCIVEGLLTNFHLPRTTLLVLVSAFAGRDNVLRAYQEAIRERYRFYSYGDAMLML